MNNPDVTQPTLHKPVPMRTRVRLPKHYLGPHVTGTVAGIAFMHVIFSYIVILDEEYNSDHGPILAITIGGSELESEDGTDNWRLR